jgi:hypothetical protein
MEKFTYTPWILGVHKVHAYFKTWGLWSLCKLILCGCRGYGKNNYCLGLVLNHYNEVNWSLFMSILVSNYLELTIYNLHGSLLCAHVQLATLKKNSVPYGILCHYGNFLDDTSYEYVNKCCHGWWMTSSIGQNPGFACQQLMMKYSHGWFEWKSLGKWQ